MAQRLGVVYCGDGAALPDIPARDLTGDEIADLPLDRKALLASKLYARPPTDPADDAPSESTDESQTEET